MYRRPERINEQDVPESQHTIFIRGLSGSVTTSEIREFFEDEFGSCTFDFIKMSRDREKLHIAIRFESKTAARQCMDKYFRYKDGQLFGYDVQLTWFRDIRRYLNHIQKIPDNSRSRRRYDDDDKRRYKKRRWSSKDKDRSHSRSESRSSKSQSPNRFESRSPSRYSSPRSYRERNPTPEPHKNPLLSFDNNNDDTNSVSLDKHKKEKEKQKESKREKKSEKSRNNDKNKNRTLNSSSSSPSLPPANNYLKNAQEENKFLPFDNSLFTDTSSVLSEKTKKEKDLKREKKIEKVIKSCVNSPSPPPVSGALTNFKNIQRTILQDVRYKPEEIDDSSVGNFRLSSLSTQKTSEEIREQKLSKLTSELLEKVNRKKLQLELSYRHDCETFGLMTRKLICKDRSLEDRLRLALLEVMKDLETEALKNLDDYLDQMIFLTA